MSAEAVAAPPFDLLSAFCPHFSQYPQYPWRIVQVWISASDLWSCHLSCLCLSPCHPCSCPFPSTSLSRLCRHCASLINVHRHRSSRLSLVRRRSRGPVVPPHRLCVFPRNQPRIALYDARTLEGACFRMFWWHSKRVFQHRSSQDTI